MKKTVTYFIAIILMGIAFFLNSCEGEPLYETDAVRRISNKTDYQLEIIIDEGQGDTLFYNIPPQSFLDIEGSCYTGFEEYCDIGWIALVDGFIFFDKERIQSFDSNPLGCGGIKNIGGHIWGSCGYQLIENTETLQVFEYKITDTDYNNAEIL
jgi:hypothetical protein